MEKLFTLLELQRRAQEAPTRAELVHLIVNETHKLVPYGQAIFWSLQGDSIKLEKLSGNAVLDEKSSYALSVGAKIKDLISSDNIVLLAPLAEANRHAAALIFKTPAEGILGGLWLESAQDFTGPECHLLEELAVSYAQSLALMSLRQQKMGAGAVIKKFSQRRKYVLLALMGVMLFPVRMGITAPAEIIARDADIITVPYDGMIEKINVQPGEKVVKGQVLATMEKSALTAQMESAEQALKVTESSVARLSRQSLAAPDKKSDLTAAEAEIDNKRLQFEYAESLSCKSEIRASRDGIAVFSDAHILQGHPMSTGERIMIVADATEYDVLVRVPVEAMIPIELKDELSFYLNVSPLHGYDAEIKSIGYQASPDPDGLLTYKIHATPINADDLRIGWKGTARIHGEWTVLSYSILRRPLAALRRMTGL